MKLNFKHLCLWSASVALVQVDIVAQEVPILLTPNEALAEKEIYIPPPPTEEDLRHYEMVAEADRRWSALFKDPNNPELHLSVARQYNLLGNGDIALHELERAQELGIARTDLLADIGRAYFLRGRYDDIMNEVLLDEVPFDQHGEVYLLFGQVHYLRGNLQEAFLNFYQAEQFLDEDRVELNAPLASLYSAMGEYEKAETKVDKALSIKPKDADLLMLKGDLVHRRKGAEQSYTYYEWANFYRPDDIKTEVKLAGALYNLKKYDEMVDILRKILAKDPSHPFANFVIAANFADGNNIRTATRYLNQAGDVYANFAPALLLKGKLAYASGSYAASQDALEQLITLDPNHLEGRRLLGAALLQQNKTRDALEVLEYIEKTNRLEATDYLLLGNAYVLSGNQDKGVSYLNQTSVLDVGQLSEGAKRTLEDFESGHNHGVRLNINSIISKSSSVNQMLILDAYKALAKENYREAFDNAAAIIDQDRTSPIGYNLLGLVYLGQGQVEGARSNFLRAAQIDRNFHTANLNIAKLEISLGDRNAAVNSLNQILSLDETYVAAYELLFDMAMEEGDLISAERYLVTASNANSELLSIREKLMNFYFEQNNLTKARTLANRMLNAFSDHSVPHKALGKIEFTEEKFAAARVHLQKAIELDNADDETYVMLSRALSEDNQYGAARETLQSGLYYVRDKLPLQLALINLAKRDGNYKNSHLYVNQLKLDERTKARALLFEADLYLMQQQEEDAIASFEGAARAGANQEFVAGGIAKAREIIASRIPQIQESDDDFQ